MGYRSDVQAVIYGPSDEMLRFVTASKMDDKYKLVWKEFDAQLNVFTMGAAKPDPVTVLHLKCEDVKWYTDYPDVAAWHALMVEADQDYHLHYEFIRIGEEDGDVEKDNSPDCDWLLSVGRPEIYLDVAMVLTLEGFPNETNDSPTGQE